MKQPSLTGSESFQARILRSEAARALIMCGVYAAMILLTLARRVEGCIVMAEDRVFIPYAAVLVGALVYEGVFGHFLRGAVRKGRLVPTWHLQLNAVIEIAVPALLLEALHLWSARGEHAALSAPAVLLFPITILASVMRLRPLATLWIGLAAAALHWMLTLDTILTEDLETNQDFVLLSYGVLLALTGLAGMMVSRAARRYVAEAVEEAEARERTGLKLAAVERDLEVARQIQFGLLPAGPPVFKGFDIAGMNEPADQTGGDYYDWQELPDGRLLVVMADVTGHGIGPALVMAVCRAYARASAPMDTNPASLMARLNELLCADMSGGRFITLAMAMLAPDGAVEFVSAGHGPSLHFRARDRKVTIYGGDGLPLAVMGEQVYGPSRSIPMERDDVLVMLTDGVFEWQNSAGVQYGTERLSGAIAAAAAGPAAEIVERLHADVLRFAAGTRQKDDVTIVVMKRTG